MGLGLGAAWFVITKLGNLFGRNLGPAHLTHA